MANTKTYKIKSGDTLSQIAKKNGMSLQALLTLNPSIKNANKIRAGQSIKLPKDMLKTVGMKADSPYARLSKTQMNMLRNKNKDNKKQETATAAIKREVKMSGAQTTPTPKKAKAAMKKKSGNAAMLEKARKLKAQKMAAKKKSKPAIPSNNIAASKGAYATKRKK